MFMLRNSTNQGKIEVFGLDNDTKYFILSRKRHETNKNLKNIMCDIHQEYVKYGNGKKQVNCFMDIKIVRFIKFIDAMVA